MPQFRVTINWTNHRISTPDDYHEDTVTMLLDTEDEVAARIWAKTVVTAGGTADVEVHEVHVEEA